MKFELKKKLVAKSERVKSVEFHPTFPWVLIGLYNGSISIYDFNTQALLQYLEITSQPIRCAKFIADKNWFVCGSDDKKIRVFNYNTMEKVKEFDAHNDFIRSICIHPKEPWLLSCSDDQTISLWDIEKGFTLIRSYEEHKNFVMRIAINPKDLNMFASAGMDLKIKIWSFTATNSNLTLDGHTKGVTSVAFCPLNDKPYLASGSDDKTIKIWDYTNRHCIFTLEGHEDNISSISFHSELPILITGSEDHSCKFWNINTFKLEESKVFGYDTIWDISVQPGNVMIALGCEEATVVLRMGNDQPLATFNASQAKIIYAKQNVINSINLKVIGEVKDGEIIDIPPKNLGTTELYPLAIKFSPNGRHFAVISDKEFVVSTSGVYRSSCVGNCTDLAWSEGGDFVIKDGSSVKVYKNLSEAKSFKPGFAFDSVFGGPFFSVKSSEAVYIYDFETSTFLRKIDVQPTSIVWSDSKKSLAVICDDVTYILKVFPEKIHQYIEDNENNGNVDEEGCVDGFDISYEINDKISNAIFIDEILIFLNTKNKINYAIEDKIFPITTLNNNYSLLGYLPSINKILLINKSFQLVSYNFPQSFINYQVAILKKDFETASKIFSLVPSDYIDKVTKFLEKFDLLDLSYNITTNPSDKFSLAIKLNKINDAYELAKVQNNTEYWKTLADLALSLGEFKIAEESMLEAKDYNGLMLYYSCISDKKKLLNLAEICDNEGMYNISFSCFFQINDLEKCLYILLKSNKIPEAALFCRTYLPSKLNSVIDNWNNELNNEETNNRISFRVINPIESINENKLLEMESITNNYYNLAKNSSTLNSDNLMKFNDIDLENLYNENGSLDIDLSSLLNIV